MKELSTLLHQYNQVELEQKQNNGLNINDMHLPYAPGIIPKIPKNSFFKKSFVEVTKQNRFSFMPTHTHDFLEINYMFSGHSSQIINGNHLELTSGQLLVMGRDVFQTYGYMDEDDILVNILIDIDKLSSTDIEQIEPAKAFIKLIFDEYHSSNNYNNFLVYDLNNLPVQKELIELFIYSSFTRLSPIRLRENLIKAIISGFPQPIINTSKYAIQPTVEISKILDYLDKNFMDISLKKLSQHFGYNTNYLGNKLKSFTGLTFKELQNPKRLLTAESLLVYTDLPISKIADASGFNDPSTLFRTFKKVFNTTPFRYRQIRKNNDQG